MISSHFWLCLKPVSTALPNVWVHTILPKLGYLQIKQDDWSPYDFDREVLDVQAILADLEFIQALLQERGQARLETNSDMQQGLIFCEASLWWIHGKSDFELI